MIIGMIRYAIPTEPDEFFNSTKKIKELYKDPYFSDRFKLFCGVTLKSFSEQTNKDFVLLVYNSTLIPEDRKILFDKIEKEYSFIRCIYLSNNKMYIPEELKEDKQITFRIDNDDGVAKDFIEKLQKVKNESKDINFIISIPKIRKIMRIDKDKYKTISFDYPLKTHSMGLAYFSDNEKTIMDLKDHTKIYNNYPVKLLNGYGGLQILNGYNVGNSIGNAKHIVNRYKLTNILKQENYASVDLESLPIVSDNTIKKSIKKKKKLNNNKKWKF